jgi:eukaryotic-like serine/threonine-protein kinase
LSPERDKWSQGHAERNGSGPRCCWRGSVDSADHQSASQDANRLAHPTELHSNGMPARTGVGLAHSTEVPSALERRHAGAWLVLAYERGYRSDTMSSPEFNARDIFAEALRFANPAECAAYLDQACGANRRRRQEVESLLSAHAQAQAGGFMDQTRPAPAPDFVSELPGTMIGRYKLLEQIGEGGFGVVYMAEQLEPVQRKVALKIIKPGMDTRVVVARFEAERQALALMDHPNIAKVLDAGAIETGRPYFVMELVRGIPITDYCDQKELPMAERLQLFIRVCHAVQHAHQKGIIHRDLKPSNVLVTLHDGEPVPKVIDFGVAKALGQKLTEKTLFTGFAQMLGTPAYMSPEQAELSGLDVDTRSDIYSLGVLLYELLTGVTPFDKETLAKAALDEIRRIIREAEPPKPSTRLQTLGNRLREVAKHRHADPAALSRLVRGDLDWIAMKCLEKDRTRRYETASGLAADIQRHLGNEAVTARPPTMAYRLSRTVWRHQLVFAAATVVVLALAVGLGLAATAYFRERQARKQASEAAKDALAFGLKAEQLAQALVQAQGEGEHWLLQVGGRLSSLREAAQAWPLERIQRELHDRPELEADLLIYRGRRWVACEAHETNVTAALDDFLKDDPEAIPMLKEGLRLRTELHGKNDASAAAAHTILADALLDSATRFAARLSRRTAEWTNTLAEMESHAREAVRIGRLTEPNSLDAADSLNTLSQVLQARGELGEAVSARREALAIKAKLLPPQCWALTSLRTLLGTLQEESGDLDGAEISLKSAVAGLGKYNATVMGVGVRLRLAKLLRRAGKLEQAESECREALRLAKAKLASPEAEPQYDQSSVRGSLMELCGVLAEQGKFNAAVEACREALALAEAQGTPAYRYRRALGRLLAKWSLADSKAATPSSALTAAALTRAREAEQLLRATEAGAPSVETRGDLGLTIMALVAADSGLPPEARSARLQEAQQLLLASYSALRKQDIGGDEATLKARRDGAAWLVQLYELWKKAEETAKWKEELKSLAAKSTR